MLAIGKHLIGSFLSGGKTSGKIDGASPTSLGETCEILFVAPYDPNKVYEKPSDVAHDLQLEREQKLSLLNEWISAASAQYRSTLQMDYLHTSREASNVRNFLLNEIAVENERAKN